VLVGLKSLQDDILSQSQVDLLYHLIRNLQKLSSQQQNDFLITISDYLNLFFETSQTNAHPSIEIKNNTNIIFYFFLNATVSFENISKSTLNTETKSKSKASSKTKSSSTSSVKEFKWFEWRKFSLEFIFKYLSSDQSQLWAMGLIHENVLMLIWKYILQLLEEKPIGINGTGKSEVAMRKLCVDILTQAVQQLERQCSQHSTDALSSFLTAILDSLCRYEHMAPYVSEICANCCPRGGSSHVCNEIMKEIGRINMTELSRSNATGVKNLGGFLTSLGEIAPAITTQYLALILNHLDSEAYQIRYNLTLCLSDSHRLS
jgi:condensin complex subunit 1